ncbi:hypothetical protein Ga0061063_0848 [Gulbenkiania indica]|uniref:Uncharacterized protein n=1 Tax=Gulbenkiania indica TaxID=375574 RepID=A0A0K6GTF5_9NEIS|nr:hypothetical protein [Gulbenkiania indica]CUA82000.1 hypothetical protein Ga0061063_0848 [Gulbenkiania indica]
MKKGTVVAGLTTLAASGAALGWWWTHPAVAVRLPSANPEASAVTASVPAQRQTLETALADYRRQQGMRPGPLPGTWLLQADTGSGPDRFVGRFGVPYFTAGPEGRQQALVALLADTEAAQGDAMDSFAAAGLVRLLVFELREGRYRLLATHTQPSGAHGMAAADVQPIRMGEAAWGWQLTAGWSHQGYSQRNVDFFLATPDDIVPIGRLAVEADNAGAGCGSGAACAPTALTARWVLRPQPGQALYALDVHWQGVLEGRPLKRHLLLEAGAARRYAIPVELVELF